MARRWVGKLKIPGSRCLLDSGSLRYQCRLDSITPSGAIVNCLGFLRETERGDKVLLHLQSDDGDIPCRVTQIAAAKIQLRFIG